MSDSILIDPTAISPTAPVYVNIHLALTLSITPDQARQQVNRQLVPELGTGLAAREPELRLTGERITWRVPIVLSLPGLGDLGQVGAVDVDAQTGHIALDADAHERLVQHANRLYAGATLPAK
jgi:hypothetical protein